MFREKTTVLENKKVAPGHYVLRLASAKIAGSAKPGQFVQVLCSDATDPLLPRPFSFLSATKKDFSILYHVVGKGTRLLSLAKTGESIWATGPFGNGFMQGIRGKGKGVRGKETSFLLVGGGVGIPPLYHLSEVLVKEKFTSKNNIHVFLGARDQSLLLCQKEFEKLGVQLHLTTDNGSKGPKGFVTQILEDFLVSLPLTPYRLPLIFTCGPTPMLRAVSAISQKYEAPCQVSVEEPMACGFGACIGCAIKVKSATGHRFAMACSEGPVFLAENIIW